MKKLKVVTIALALCSMSFAASLPKRPVNSQPEKEAAARQQKQDALLDFETTMVAADGNSHDAILFDSTNSRTNGCKCCWSWRAHSR